MRSQKLVLCVVLFALLFPLAGRADALSEGKGQILYEAWPNLWRNEFTDGTGWVNLPGDSLILSEFNYWQRPEKVSATRMSAMITVPEDGHYTFYVTSKGESRVYLSQNGNPDDLETIIHLDQDTNRFRDGKQGAWFKTYRQESDTYVLKKGTIIFLTAVNFFFPTFLNSRDGDTPPNHFTVGWSRNGSPVDVIKDEDCFIPWDIWGAHFAEQPAVYGAGDDFIEIEWPRSNLGMGITSFNIYRDNKLIAVNVDRYRYLDKTAEAGKSYRYSVEAVDILGRVSPRSAGVTAIARHATVAAAGTGLTAAFYLPSPVRNKDLGSGPYVAAYVDSTCFLKNRKGIPLFQQGAVPSFFWYRNTVIDIPHFTGRALRMEGFIEAPYDGEWMFTLRASDRAHVWINRRLLFSWQYYSDARTEFGIHHNSAAIYLKAGERVPIRVESDYRTLQLEWSHILREQEPIPQEYLYPSNMLGKNTFNVISSTESFTNPAHLEVKVGSEVNSIGCNVDGKPVRAVKLDDYRYLMASEGRLAVEVNPDREAEAVFSLHSDSGSTIETTRIRWKPIVLGGSKETVTSMTIRQGDELLFLNGVTGKRASALTLSTADGNKDVQPKEGRLTFNSPGVFLVKLPGHNTYGLNLSVVPVSNQAVIPLYLGGFRYFSVPDELTGLFVEPADDRAVEITPSCDPAIGNRLILRAPNIGPSFLIFRKMKSGPIIGVIPTDAFMRWKHTFKGVRKLKPRGTLCHWVMLVSHVVEGTSIRVEGVTRNRWCENGDWFQFYELKSTPDSLLRVPLIYGNNSWGRVNNSFYHNGARISNDYLGVAP